ncbi:MAG: DUF1641 domain-containing protein [Ignavibacteria bacterium]|nr:DUF1641 domain-containing protein [Ignavibacteria bacterium]
METTLNNSMTGQRLEEMERKLDLIVEQLAEMQSRQRVADELKQDLNLIGKDVFNTLVHELKDITPYVDGEDLVLLVKKLLRNVRKLNTVFDQLESLHMLMEDLSPVVKEFIMTLVQRLDELERKGYKEFLQEGIKIVDTVVTNFTPDDVRLLRENVTSILLTVRNLTQPQMLSTVDHALGFFEKMDIDVEEKPSLLAILKELQDPEVRRGILFALKFTKRLSSQPDTLQYLNTRTQLLSKEEHRNAQETT